MRIDPADGLVDSNLLLRFIQPKHPLYLVTVKAIHETRSRGAVAWACPQNFTEFWAVATRPIGANGLGLTTLEAERELARLEALFPSLPDGPTIYPEWRRLVTLAGVSGKPTHDARLMAVAVTHGIRNLLTFNTGDFARFASLVPSVAVIDPSLI